MRRGPRRAFVCEREKYNTKAQHRPEYQYNKNKIHIQHSLRSEPSAIGGGGGEKWKEGKEEVKLRVSFPTAGSMFDDEADVDDGDDDRTIMTVAG